MMHTEREQDLAALAEWLTELGIRWDGNLVDLQSLDLRSKELTSLPESIGQLTNLQWLSLSDNKLISLPESIGQLTNLQSLFLYHNQLTSLPESIVQLTNLQSLFLYHNQLISLSESIVQLTNLRSLDLGSNQLISFPEWLGQLTNLKQLFLNDNKLTSLPKSLGQLTNLQWLSLSGNKLTSLPEWLIQLTRLQDLDLSENKLTSLPEWLGQMNRLQQLYLSGNQLTDMSPLSVADHGYDFNFLDSLKVRIHLTFNIFKTTFFSYLNSAMPWWLWWLNFESNALAVHYFNVNLPRRYWTKFSDWQPEWLLDENNAEIRRILIEQMGYEKICDRLKAKTIDTWREYTLLKIDGVETVYENENEPIDREPMVLLKMTCPSTEHIHILRVPPEMTSAEAAITWVNHGIHPDEFITQT